MFQMFTFHDKAFSISTYNSRAHQQKKEILFEKCIFATVHVPSKNRNTSLDDPFSELLLNNVMDMQDSNTFETRQHNRKLTRKVEVPWRRNGLSDFDEREVRLGEANEHTEIGNVVAYARCSKTLRMR